MFTSVKEDIREYLQADNMEDAGYNSIWGPFVEVALTEGLKTAAKRASLLHVEPSRDEFEMGKAAALDDIAFVVDDWDFMASVCGDGSGHDLAKNAAYNGMGRVEMALFAPDLLRGL